MAAWWVGLVGCAWFGASSEPEPVTLHPPATNTPTAATGRLHLPPQTHLMVLATIAADHQPDVVLVPDPPALSATPLAVRSAGPIPLTSLWPAFSLALRASGGAIRAGDGTSTVIAGPDAGRQRALGLAVLAVPGIPADELVAELDAVGATGDLEVAIDRDSDALIVAGAPDAVDDLVRAVDLQDPAAAPFGGEEAPPADASDDTDATARYARDDRPARPGVRLDLRPALPLSDFVSFWSMLVQADVFVSDPDALARDRVTVRSATDLVPDDVQTVLEAALSTHGWTLARGDSDARIDRSTASPPSPPTAVPVVEVVALARETAAAVAAQLPPSTDATWVAGRAGDRLIVAGPPDAVDETAASARAIDAAAR